MTFTRLARRDNEDRRPTQQVGRLFVFLDATGVTQFVGTSRAGGTAEAIFANTVLI